MVALATPYGHSGSKRNLLGDNPSEELVGRLSNETQVTAETPPTFLAHTNADAGVPAENSLLFVMALRKAKVPVELHLFEKGQHGLGLGGGTKQFGIAPDEAFQEWPKLCAIWLKRQGFLDRASKPANSAATPLITGRPGRRPRSTPVLPAEAHQRLLDRGGAAEELPSAEAARLRNSAGNLRSGPSGSPRIANDQAIGIFPRARVACTSWGKSNTADARRRPMAGDGFAPGVDPRSGQTIVSSSPVRGSTLRA